MKKNLLYNNQPQAAIILDIHPADERQDNNMLGKVYNEGQEG